MRSLPAPDQPLRLRSRDAPPVAPDLTAWQVFLLFIDEALPGVLFTLGLFVAVWLLGLLLV